MSSTAADLLANMVVRSLKLRGVDCERSMGSAGILSVVLDSDPIVFASGGRDLLDRVREPDRIGSRAVGRDTGVAVSRGVSSPPGVLMLILSRKWCNFLLSASCSASAAFVVVQGASAEVESIESIVDPVRVVVAIDSAVVEDLVVRSAGDVDEDTGARANSDASLS